MSKTVDSRVVEMSFENAKFQKGIQQSTTALEKFSNDLNKFAASGSTMGQLAGAVDTIGERFTFMGDFAFRALGRIKEGILDVAQTAMRDLVIEPRMQGFNEYELKMGAIQTIMAGTGESLETVNSYLEDLNTYADKTIYSFADMTQNIGKFTNAGVKLKDAVASIQGIANLAAVSGANAQQASHAMYNFAQALSSGFVKLIDWKSIENANMATQEFKTYLLEAGLAAGTLEKNADGMYRTLTTNAQGKYSDWFTAASGFNDALQHQWMTTKVLNDTLGDYGDITTEIGKKAFAAATQVKTFSQLMDTLKEAAGSGWARTFEIVIGDFEEAKALWTNVSDSVGAVIDSFSDARNAMLSEWKKEGGRTAVIEGLTNVFTSLGKVLGVVGKAYREVFPKTTGKELAAISKNFAAFAKTLQPSEKTLKTLHTIFKALFTAVRLIIAPFKFAFEAVKTFIGVFAGSTKSTTSFVDVLLKIGLKLAEYINYVDEAFKKSKIFSEGLKLVEKAAIFVRDKYAELVKFLKENPIVQGIIDGISDGWKYLVDAAVKMGETIIEWFKKVLGISSPSTVFHEFGVNIAEGLVSGIKAGYDIIRGALTTFANFISEVFYAAIEKASGIFNSIGDFISNDFMGALANFKDSLINFSEKIRNIDMSGLDTIKEKFKSIFDLSAVLEKISGFFTGFMAVIKTVWDWTKTTFGPLIDFLIEKMRQFSLEGLGQFLSGAGSAMAGGGFMYFFVNLGKTLKSFSSILDGFSSIGQSVSRVLDGVGGALEAFQSRVRAEILRSIAVSVGILTVALIALSFLDWGGIGRGITAISVLVAELVAAMRGLNGAVAGMGGGSGKMIAIGVSVMFLASALKSLSKIDSGKLWTAVGVMAVLMTVLGTFARVVLGRGLESGAMQLIGIAIALKIISGSLISLSKANPAGVGLALGALVTVMVLLGAVIHGMDSTKIAVIAKNLLMLAIAVRILASAIGLLGRYDMMTLAKGIGAIVTVLTLIGIILTKFPTDGPQNIMALATAMLILTIPIGILGNMDWMTLIKGIGGIGAAIFLINKALQGFPKDGAPAMFKFATAMLVLSVAIKALGGADLWSIIKGVGGLSGMLYLISQVLKGWPKDAAPKLLALAFALLMLVIPVTILGLLPWDVLIGGLIGTIGALAGIMAVMKKFYSDDISKGLPKLALGLTALALAMTLFVVPITLLGLLPWDVLLSGLGAFAAILFGLFLFLNNLPEAKIINAIGKSIMKLGIGIGIIAIGVAALGMLPFMTVVQGLGALGIALGGLVALLHQAPTNMDKIAKDLRAVAISIGLVMAVVLVTGVVGAETMWSGIVSMAGALTVVGIAVTKFPASTQALGTAKSVAALAGALILLTVPLLLLGKLNLSQIVNGLIGLAGTLAIIGLASTLIATGSVAMLMFGGAVALIGVGAYLTAKAIDQLVTTIGRILNAIGISIDAIRGALTAFGDWLWEWVDWIASKLGKGWLWGKAEKNAKDDIVRLKKEYENAEEPLAEASAKLGAKANEGLKSETEKMPAIGEKALNDLAKEYSPDSVHGRGVIISTTKLGGRVTGAMEDSVSPSKMKLVATNSLGEKGLAGGVKESAPLILGPMEDVMKQLEEKAGGDPEKMNALMNKLLVSKDGMYGAFTDSKEMMGKGVDQYMKDILASAENGVDIEAWKKMGFSMPGGDGKSGIGLGFLEGGKGFGDLVANFGGDALKKAEESFKVDDYVKIGENIPEGLLKGVESKFPEVLAKIDEMAKGVEERFGKKLEIGSPSKVFEDMGKSIDQGLAFGIMRNVSLVLESSEEMGDTVTRSLSGALKRVKIGDLDMDLQPTITPVMDLSQVKKDAVSISDMLNDTTAMTVTPSVSVASGAVKRQRSVQNETKSTSPISTTARETTTSETTNTSNTFNFNVRNENDARKISTKIGSLLQRQNMAKGVVALR